MIRIVRGFLAFCVIGVALLAAGMPASASTVTVNFAGTITDIASGSNPLGGIVNQTVSGSITFGPVNGPFFISTPTTDVTTYWSSNTAWAFSLGGVSGGGLTTATLYKENAAPTANFGADFFVDGHSVGHSDQSLDIWTRANGADASIAPLTLATIPATLTDWAARFAVAIIATGSLSYGGTTYSFDLTQVNVAATPLPASLLLFLSAMLGLGGLAWQRGMRVRAEPV
jgi:hypothetical protein